eukprot:5313010-Prymnesium_polylepis.2
MALRLGALLPAGCLARGRPCSAGGAEGGGNMIGAAGAARTVGARRHGQCSWWMARTLSMSAKAPSRAWDTWTTARGHQSGHWAPMRARGHQSGYAGTKAGTWAPMRVWPERVWRRSVRMCGGEACAHAVPTVRDVPTACAAWRAGGAPPSQASWAAAIPAVRASPPRRRVQWSAGCSLPPGRRRCARWRGSRGEPSSGRSCERLEGSSHAQQPRGFVAAGGQHAQGGRGGAPNVREAHATQRVARRRVKARRHQHQLGRKRACDRHDHPIKGRHVLRITVACAAPRHVDIVPDARALAHLARRACAWVEAAAVAVQRHVQHGGVVLKHVLHAVACAFTQARRWQVDAVADASEACCMCV